CVLAARLSEDPERDVVLLEAGPDYPTIDELPRELADGRLATASHDWGFTAEPDANGRRLTLLRARVTGGCSATNVTYATRGTRADYDAWRDLGNAGWGFDDVLPFFCRAETDADFGADPWHGDAGPLPIRRAPVEEQTELTRAFIDAAIAAGHEPVADLNRPGAVGVGAAPMNTRRGI